MKNDKVISLIDKVSKVLIYPCGVFIAWLFIQIIINA